MTVAATRARIAKLRALAARPGTPHEGATAARIAAELEKTLPAVTVNDHRRRVGFVPPDVGRPYHEARPPAPSRRYHPHDPRQYDPEPNPGGIADTVINVGFAHFIEFVIDEFGRRTMRHTR